MRRKTEALLTGVNKAIIKMRGVYAVWCREQGMSYHELLVWYSLRSFGPCTQKQICEHYLLPKQTIHNIVTGLREKGYVELRQDGTGWREKVIAPTEAGLEYSRGFMEPLEVIEGEAVAEMGEEDLAAMTELAMRYGAILERKLTRPQ